MPYVSIHAPTWGATPFAARTTQSALCFNPRTHMGCDVEFPWRPTVDDVSIHAPTWGATSQGALPPQIYAVSIHAPTWGATCDQSRTLYSELGFNPRTHMGCDVGSVIMPLPRVSFNPRTHMGCDKFLCPILLHLPCFNPRTHMGCDILLLNLCAKL